MVIQDEKSAFGERLNKSLDRIGFERTARAEGLSKITGLSPQATRKWLKGQSIATMEHSIILAKLVGEPVDYLLTGRADVKDDSGSYTAIPIKTQRLAQVAQSLNAKQLTALTTFLETLLESESQATMAKPAPPDGFPKQTGRNAELNQQPPEAKRTYGTGND